MKIDNQHIISSIFNKYFSSVADKILGLNINEKTDTNSEDNAVNSFHNAEQAYPRINFVNTSTQEIGKIIKSLKTKNSYGYDEISVKILKWSSPYIVSPLTYICNKCLEKGIFPSRLKYSNVKPIYKSGDKLNIANFRQISLLISFYKIVEKVIYLRIHQHVVQNQILAKEQYGFRSKSSTDKAAYTLTHDILTAFNNKQIVGAGEGRALS